MWVLRFSKSDHHPVQHSVESHFPLEYKNQRRFCLTGSSQIEFLLSQTIAVDTNSPQRYCLRIQTPDHFELPWLNLIGMVVSETRSRLGIHRVSATHEVISDLQNILTNGFFGGCLFWKANLFYTKTKLVHFSENASNEQIWTSKVRYYKNPILKK